MSEMSREETISMLKQIGRHECIWMVCRHNEVYETIDNAIKALKEQRPHGEWVYIGISETTGLKIVKCTHCKKRQYGSTDFCSNCGADMRGERNE